MRIAIFSESYLAQSNHVETHISILEKGLQKLGHDVLIVSSDLEAEEGYEQDNMVFCPAKLSGSIYGQSARKSKLSYLKEKVMEFRPDIIHLMTFEEVGAAGLDYALQSDLPLAITIHDLQNALEGFGGNRAVNLLSKNYCRSVLKKAVSFADVAATDSPDVVRSMEELHVACHLSPIPLCIDPTLFHLDCAGEEQITLMRKRLDLGEKTGIIAVGNLNIPDEMELLLEQWAQVISSGDRLHLVIVGNGKALTDLQNKAQLLGISSQVTFPGRISHEEMPACYAACSAYVSASQSNLVKTSVYEAISCGLPAILFEGGASCSLISNGINGFQYQQPEKMAELVKKLTTMDAKTIDTMKKLVNKTTLSFTPEALAKAMVDCYKTASEEHFIKSKKKE